jgi:NADH-quinone oxidoreductase subunit J
MPTDGTMPIVFFVLAAVTLASAICAMSLRNLVHCGLCLALTFAGLAAIYLQLNAEFVGLAQILVYVGAVAVLIVFTILLTKNAEVHISPVSRSWAAGLVVAIIVCASLVVPLVNSPSLNRAPAMNVEAPVRLIGEKLMTQYVIPLEAIALVLTAALLGAVVIAMRDEPDNKVGRGVLTAPRRESEILPEGSDASPRRAEDSAPYHRAGVVSASRPVERSSTT